MSDEPDLDRLFTRLSTADLRSAPDDHPAPEKLSAYLADELTPEEDDALQEHFAACPLCTGLLLDLERFLDPPEEDRPREGVADFATAAEWREMKGKLAKTGAPAAGEPKRRLLRRIVASPALAAVLALLFVGAAYRAVVLRQELARPRTVQVKTIEAPGSERGTPSAVEPTPFRLGNIALFDTHSDRPYPKYRLSFIDKDGRSQLTLEAQEDENGMIGLTLPAGSLTPGIYRVQVLGLEGTAANPIREFNIRILQ